MSTSTNQPSPGNEVALDDWFGVRTVYQWVNDGCFEERVTVWRAKSFAEAVQLAEAEAREYESASVMYLGLAQAYDSMVDDDPIEPSMEVFSLVRRSELPPDEYLTRYFDTGQELGSTVE